MDVEKQERRSTFEAIVDSHAHLTCKEVLPEADALVERAAKEGVTQIVNICTDQASLEGGLTLSKRHPKIYNTAATTPHDVEADGEAFFPLVEGSVDHLVAIGETGLDYYYEHSPKKLQQHFLERYFELALRAQLPIVYHCRDAFEDLFAMADKHYRDRPALLHCFTGSIEEARGCLDRGWYVSFSGIITYKKSEALREVVKYLPLERILIETDTPYLAPQSNRGKRNEPAYIVETAAKIAEIKGCTEEEVARVTADNARQFFRLPVG